LDRFGNFNQIQKHGNGGAGFGAFPLAVGYQDTGYYNGGTQGPVIILQQSEPPTPPPPPPPPAQPELREYMWRESKNDPSATFTILSKDGNSISAVAVWVQNNTVLHIAPNGEAGQIPLNAVDRQATRAVNAARNLILSLPAESSRHR